MLRFVGQFSSKWRANHWNPTKIDQTGANFDLPHGCGSKGKKTWEDCPSRRSDVGSWTRIDVVNTGRLLRLAENEDVDPDRTGEIIRTGPPGGPARSHSGKAPPPPPPPRKVRRLSHTQRCSAARAAAGGYQGLLRGPDKGSWEGQRHPLGQRSRDAGSLEPGAKLGVGWCNHEVRRPDVIIEWKDWEWMREHLSSGWEIPGEPAGRSQPPRPSGTCRWTRGVTSRCTSTCTRRAGNDDGRVRHFVADGADVVTSGDCLRAGLRTNDEWRVEGDSQGRGADTQEQRRTRLPPPGRTMPSTIIYLLTMHPLQKNPYLTFSEL